MRRQVVAYQRLKTVINSYSQKEKEKRKKEGLALKDPEPILVRDNFFIYQGVNKNLKVFIFSRGIGS